MTTYRLVPVEPTEEMLKAATGWRGEGIIGDFDMFKRIYKAMLQAAPVPQNELLEAARAIRDDLINRAKNYEQEDAIPVVAPGNSVWKRFCAAIHNAEQGDTTS